MEKRAEAMGQSFWKNDGKRVSPTPQNPIAAKQALYNKDTRANKVSLAQGMVFNDKDRVRVYHPESNEWFHSLEEARGKGIDASSCEVFENRAGKIYHSPVVFVAERRALARFGKEQFGSERSENPSAYGTPTAPDLLEAMTYDGEDIYGPGNYNPKTTISFQTLGMASGYKHLTLPVLDSVRKSIGLPPFENVIMGSNFYGAYPATFDDRVIKRYRYMNDHGNFDLASFKKAAKMFDSKTSIFLFDMSAGNNFVGTKRTRQDNENILDVLVDGEFYSEHDIAYPNFDPSFDLDFELYRLMAKHGVPHGVQSSRGKKDKYASRLAFHHVFLGTDDQRAEIMSHMVRENRNRFLALPKNWGYLVEIARDPALRKAHKEDEQIFVDIVNDSRKNLSKKLEWEWMARRSGMFDMVEISHKGVETMGEEHAIYAVPARDQNFVGDDGEPVEVTRIKHGLGESQIQLVADALKRIQRTFPSPKGKPNPDIIYEAR